MSIVVIAAIVRIVATQPNSAEEPTIMEPAIVESTSMNLAECGVEAAAMESATTVKTAPAVRRGIGEI